VQTTCARANALRESANDSAPQRPTRQRSSQAKSHNAKSHKSPKNVVSLPINQPAPGPQFGALRLTMSSCLTACKRRKKAFEDKRSLTQRSRKLTTCKAHEMPKVSCGLASDDDPAPTASLALARVGLAKRRSEMAKSNAGKANLPPTGTETGRKTTGDPTNADAALDQFSPHNSKSEDNVEPAALSDEVGCVDTAPVQLPHHNRWVPPTQLTLIGSSVVEPGASNEPLMLLL